MGTSWEEIDLSTIDVTKRTIRTIEPDGITITWRCWHCGINISKHPGSIWCDTRFDEPTQPKWTATCDECEIPPELMYWAESTGLTTTYALLKWFAHMGEKRWFGDTDWHRSLTGYDMVMTTPTETSKS